MSKPITPEEIAQEKLKHIPDAVFDAFNVEITLNYDEGEATISQKAVVDRIVATGISSDEIYDKGYLNIEVAYREAGWTVSYNKRDYNEDASSTFTFKKRRKR